MKISVIINTYNRALYLRQALGALQYQTYDDFEVVVVNGPSTDDTDQVLSEFEGTIKRRDCASRNISASRNIGIKAAQGEVIAFLDDDAVPDQFWLANIASCFDKYGCSVIGGFVFDNTGSKFQARYILTDRHADSTYLEEICVPQQTFCFPGTRQFLTPMGCNVAFRRRDLVAVGGFDEQYDYFLDETDVVVRMIDRGFTVRIEPSVIVYHKFASSGIRKEKWPLDWTSIVKNRLYYVCVNNFGKVSLQAAEKETEHYVGYIVGESKSKLGEGFLTRDEAISCITTAKEGLKKGKEDATATLRKGICGKEFFQSEESFLPYRIAVRQQLPLVLCLLSPAYPPASTDGIPRYTKLLAEGLVQRGCIVHVITLEGMSNTVDFENGVWIHRMGELHDAGPCPYDDLPMPIWQEVAKYKSEVVRIDEVIHHVDLVQGPIWDLAPLGLLFSDSFSSGVFMCTSFAIKKELEPVWYKANKAFVDELVAYESYVIRNAKFLNFDSEALYRLCLKLYGDSLHSIPHRVIHLGTPGAVKHEARAKGNGELNILFVGRLEERKGIDIVLDSIPELVSEFPKIKFQIVGRNDIAAEDGKTYMAQFLDKNKGKGFLKNVDFLGHVSDEALGALYENCDIFVAPSRYESFGQILVEAMAHGKPIISSAVGGIVEVLGDPPAGLLIGQGDKRAFYEALRLLITDKEKREELGRAARKRYEEAFSEEIMCAATEKFFREQVDHERHQ